MLVGSTAKIYEHDDLYKAYQKSHRDCKDYAEGVADDALRKAVIIGRNADGVENERKRSVSFFQSSLNKCQAHCKRHLAKDNECDWRGNRSEAASQPATSAVASLISRINEESW